MQSLLQRKIGATLFFSDRDPVRGSACLYCGRGLLDVDDESDCGVVAANGL